MFNDSEFLKIVLGVFGIPDIAFDFADPLVLLYAVIFSEQIFVFFSIYHYLVFYKVFRLWCWKETNAIYG